MSANPVEQTPVYQLVFRSVSDPAGAQEYLEGAKPLVEQAGGVYLARGAVPTVLEGDRGLTDGEGVVLIRFPSREVAETFYNSEGYAPFRELARASFVRSVWLFDGIPGVT